jgi:hypothetical protein
MRLIPVISILLSLTACGGGGSSSNGGGNPINTVPPSTPADADFGGLWSGTFAHADQTFEDIVALTAADGSFVFVSLDTFGPGTYGQYSGTASIDVGQVTGTGQAYAAAGSTWSDGSSVAAVALTADVVEHSSMTGSLNAGAATSGTFELEYDPNYERASSLDLLTGVWYVYNDLLNPIATFTFEPDGSFLGQSVSGCQSSGSASIIDATRNLYAWDVTIINCPIAGTYAGLGALGDAPTDDPATSQNNVFVVAMSNGVRANLLPLER